MISKALDDNNNLIIENGRFKTVTGIDQVAQAVRSKLLFYMGEWFLDASKGTPYHQEIFKRPVNLDIVESVLKSQILKTVGVTELISFSLDFNSTSRSLSVSYSASTVHGIIENSEVTIDA